MGNRLKSYAAFKITMQSITVETMYLWTFTMPEVVDVSVTTKTWNNFCRGRNGFVNCFPEVCGIRVFELHPGGHGLHVHAVIDRRVPVDIVRKIARRVGFGRVHVKEVPGHACMYLGKYLRKQERSEALKGVRTWSGFGGTQACRVKDLICDSDFSRAYRYCASAIRGWEHLRFGERMAFVTCYNGGMTLGECFESIGWKEGGRELHKFLGKVDAIMDTKEKLAKQRLRWTRQDDGVPLSEQEKADRIRKSTAKALAEVGIMKRDKKSETGYSYRNRDVEPF